MSIDNSNIPTSIPTISRLNDSDYDDIFTLTQKPHIMSSIGNGHIWSSKKIKDLLKFSNEDWKKPANSEYFYWKINFDDTFVGLVSFHVSPWVQKFAPKLTNEFFLTIIIDDDFHGQGIAPIAINLAIEEIAKYKKNIKFVYALINITNKPSHSAILKSDFTSITKFKYYNKLYILYNRSV